MAFRWGCPARHGEMKLVEKLFDKLVPTSQLTLMDPINIYTVVDIDRDTHQVWLRTPMQKNVTYDQWYINQYGKLVEPGFRVLHSYRHNASGNVWQIIQDLGHGEWLAKASNQARGFEHYVVRDRFIQDFTEEKEW